MAIYFDAKTFNAEAFGKYSSRIPNTKKNELLKCGAIRGNKEIHDAFANQTGTHYAVLPMLGKIGGAPLNYNGSTDITTETTKTFNRGVITIGRAKGWTEKDFSFDITGGVNFMDNVAAQLVDYWAEVYQNILIKILKGVFSMTGAVNLKFVEAHTLNITEKAGADGAVGATTLNTASQKACGDNKNIFKMAIMHSTVATNLENLQIIKYFTQTDANGMQREVGLATWNGRVVFIDDSMPTEEFEGEKYAKVTASHPEALKVTAAGTGEREVALATVNGAKFDSKWTVKEGDYAALVPSGISYTTYLLGIGAFDYEDLGVLHPYEMARNPYKNGGEDTLITRKRLCYAPFGISYKTASTISPDDADLENGANWELVKSEDKETIDHKAIPIARIISRG